MPRRFARKVEKRGAATRRAPYAHRAEMGGELGKPLERMSERFQKMMRTTAIAAAAALAVTLLAGCGSDKPTKGDSTAVFPPGSAAPVATGAASTTSKSSAVLAPTDTGRSQTYGIDTIILSVEDTNSRYGAVTVFTFQLVNTSDKVFEGYNWPTPTVVYGAAGTPAEHTVSLSEGYGQGVTGAIPPGARQTVKHAYKVTKGQLDQAVVTVGSILWQGNFATFQR